MRIAIAGGIASGKSTLLNFLRERGVATASADALARDILWNPDVQARLMKRFDAEEPISPVILRALLAHSDENRRAVNQIMHPYVADGIASTSATVFEVPLLFETCLHVAFDAIWVAFCSRETQSKRLYERYGDTRNREEVAWQLDSKVGLTFADSVVATDGTPEESLACLLQEAKRWEVSLVVS